jgi:hypothetical protein
MKKLERQPQHHHRAGREPVVKLACRMNAFESRELWPNERKSVLALLGPGHGCPLRCAAAHVACTLGLTEAVPLMKSMAAHETGMNPILKIAFGIAQKRFAEMERHGEIPRPLEHMMLLIGMRNSDNPRTRRQADMVLGASHIRYNVPSQEFSGMKLEPDFQFRDGEEAKQERWLNLPHLRKAHKVANHKAGEGK